VTMNQRYTIPKEISKIISNIDEKINEGTEEQRSSKPLSQVSPKSTQKENKRKLVIKSPRRKV